MAQTKQSPDPFELLARSQNSCDECSEPSNDDDDDDDDDDRESENTSFLHAAAVVAMRENNVFRRQCSLFFFFFFFFFFGFQLEKDEQHESEEGLETESKRGAWDEQRARSRARTGGGGRRTKTFVFLLFFFFFFCVQGTSSFEREKQQDVFRAAQSDDFQSLGAVLLSFEWRLRVDEHGEYDSEAQVDYSGASGAEV